MNLRTPLLLLVAGLTWPAWVTAQTWRWSNPQPNGNNITGIAQNGNVSVEVAELGQIFTGNNFYDWVPAAVPTTNNLQAVTFFGNRLVAVGENGIVVYSDDYVHFTAVSLNTTPDWLIAQAASTNLLVAVGDNAILFASTNGADWTPQSKPPGIGSDWLVSAAWGRGTFVIGGDNGYIATSTNGTSWANHRIPGTPDSIFWLSYISGSGSSTNFPYEGFWAATDGGRTWYSTNNGTSWKQFSFRSTNTLYSLAANKTTGLIAGDEALFLATNSTTWNPQTGTQTTNAPIWTYYDALAQPNGTYQLAGAAGMLVQGIPANGSYNWGLEYGPPENPVIYDWLFQVTAAAGLYVAVGDHARIMTSDNGAYWTVEALPITNSISTTNTLFLGVGGDTNLLLAVGNQGSLAISPSSLIPVVQTNLDGILVTNLANTLGVIWYSMPAPTNQDLTGVGVYSNCYYLTGSSGTLLKSSDGTNWLSCHLPVTNDLAGIASSSNQIVLVGDYGCIVTSSNGSNWTARNSGTANGLFRVHWFDGTYLAVGEGGTILLSTNAVNWSASSSGTTNWLNDAVMVSNRCYVVGNYGTVLVSTNFTSWSLVPTITQNSLYGTASQNGQLVAVGLSGSIIRSQIVPLNSPVQIQSYAQADGENVFLLNGVVDQECTLDSSTNILGPWVTGPLLDLLYGDGTLEVIQSLGADPAISQFYRCTLVP